MLIETHLIFKVEPISSEGGIYMSTGWEKLRRDLDVLAAMASEVDDYLKSDVRYWPMAHGDMPKLSLGGFLVRCQRLTRLSHWLNEAEQARLETAVTQFNDAAADKIVRTEKHAHEELGVRARQWASYLNDVQRETHVAAVNYETAVENRLMITALIQFLQNPPYQLDAHVIRNLDTLDRGLRLHWQEGPFVWAEEWAAAYPKEAYWWLYGRPA
jgi:hypothetical protein